MLHASYSWRPLGELLIDDGALTSDELDLALAEQRRTGRLIGEILVQSGFVSPFALTRALAGQHGVELEPAREEAGRPKKKQPATSAPPRWRPLGKLLLEKEFLTISQLEWALCEQRESGGRRLLGEILFAAGFLSGDSLARALAEQQGVELRDDEQAEVVAVLRAAGPEAIYEVREVEFEPRYRVGEALYESASLLEATDFAAEYVEDHDPSGVEIQRVDGTVRETVWTYSESRASANAATQKSLSETFGFDPTMWTSTR